MLKVHHISLLSSKRTKIISRLVVAIISEQMHPLHAKVVHTANLDSNEKKKNLWTNFLIVYKILPMAIEPLDCWVTTGAIIAFIDSDQLHLIVVDCFHDPTLDMYLKMGEVQPALQEMGRKVKITEPST